MQQQQAAVQIGDLDEKEFLSFLKEYRKNKTIDPDTVEKIKQQHNGESSRQVDQDYQSADAYSNTNTHELRFVSGRMPSSEHYTTNTNKLLLKSGKQRFKKSAVGNDESSSSRGAGLNQSSSFATEMAGRSTSPGYLLTSSGFHPNRNYAQMPTGPTVSAEPSSDYIDLKGRRGSNSGGSGLIEYARFAEQNNLAHHMSGFYLNYIEGKMNSRSRNNQNQQQQHQHQVGIGDFLQGSKLSGFTNSSRHNVMMGKSAGNVATAAGRTNHDDLPQHQQSAVSQLKVVNFPTIAN
jgi:hypothetical protein